MSNKNIQHKKQTEPIYWFNKASDLRASAGVIWAGMDDKYSKKIVNDLELGDGFDLAIACHKTYYMLCGLSLELIFKAIILQKNLKIPQTHDLSSLAKSIKLEYTSEDYKLLNILSEMIVWVSKYPIPTKLSKLDQYNNTYKNYFYSKEKVGNVDILRRKNIFDWNKFNKIWRKASVIFWEYSAQHRIADKQV